MDEKEIKALIRESRLAGGITALERYDETGRLSFDKKKTSKEKD